MDRMKLLLLISYIFCFMTLSQQQQQQQWFPIRLHFQFLEAYPASKLIEVNTLINIAQQFYQSSLLVQRKSQKLRFGDAEQADCSDYPVSDAISQKEFDADLVFFVVLDDSKGDTLAFSGACVYDDQTSQPVFSILGFGKAVYSKKNSGTIQFADNIVTTIHEFMHGLGFTNNLYNYYMDAYTQQIHGSTSFRRNGVLFLATPRILQYTRQYFGCPDADGNPMEDQGLEGSRDTHWERRLFYNDILIAQDQNGDYIFSIFNYKLLEDSGWYKLGDISVDPMTFGMNKGCDFLYKGCLAGTFPEYCDSKIQEYDECSWSQIGIGYCGIDDFSNTCQMIQIYDNEDCRNPVNFKTAGSLQQQDYNTLQTFTYDSRCFNGSFTNSSKSNIFTKSCHKFECQDLTSISITIGSKTILCTQDKQQLTLPNYSGMIQCPDSIQQFCYEYSECPNQCNERGFCVNKKCFCIKGYSGLGCEQICNFYRSQGQCVKTCPVKTFQDLNTLSCLGCPFNCAACTVIGSCDICQAGYILHHGSCENSYQFDTLIAQNYISKSISKSNLYATKNIQFILSTIFVIYVVVFLS